MASPVCEALNILSLNHHLIRSSIWKNDILRHLGQQIRDLDRRSMQHRHHLFGARKIKHDRCQEISKENTIQLSNPPFWAVACRKAFHGGSSTVLAFKQSGFTAPQQTEFRCKAGMSPCPCGKLSEAFIVDSERHL